MPELQIDSSDVQEIGRIVAVHRTLSWNYFRYTGDALHDAAILILFGWICCAASVAGLSLRTHVLYSIMFISRYTDLLNGSVQAQYLVFHKIFFIVSSLLTLILFYIRRDTYEHEKDTCKIGVILWGCFAVALVLTAEHSVLEVLWTFSQFLESFTMVPQYIFSYRSDIQKVGIVNLYILLMGSYRACYVMNFVYKKFHLPFYSDIVSWMSGAGNLALFFDFVLHQCTGFSFLRRFALGVDDGIQRVSQDLSNQFGALLLLHDGDGLYPAPPSIAMAEVAPASTIGVSEVVPDVVQDTGVSGAAAT